MSDQHDPVLSVSSHGSWPVDGPEAEDDLTIRGLRIHSTFENCGLLLSVPDDVAPELLQAARTMQAIPRLPRTHIGHRTKPQTPFDASLSNKGTFRKSTPSIAQFDE